MSISPDNKYGRSLASDKQFTLHATLLWVLRAHVEVYFKKPREISSITNVKKIDICGHKLMWSYFWFYISWVPDSKFKFFIYHWLKIVRENKKAITKSERSQEGNVLIPISRAHGTTQKSIWTKIFFLSRTLRSTLSLLNFAFYLRPLSTF